MSRLNSTVLGVLGVLRGRVSYTAVETDMQVEADVQVVTQILTGTSVRVSSLWKCKNPPVVVRAKLRNTFQCHTRVCQILGLYT